MSFIVEVLWRRTQYIRTHGLQCHEKPRNIDADANMKALIRLTDADSLNFFNLMDYVSVRFAKV